MRKRTHEIKLRLNDAELKHLNDMVSKSLYKREVFLRLLLNGYVMQECPKDYMRFRAELIHMATELRMFDFSKSLTPKEVRKLLQVADEIWKLEKKLDVIYCPYYTKKKAEIPRPLH